MNLGTNSLRRATTASLLLLFAAALGGANAKAEEFDPRALDGNGDGAVSAAEAEQALLRQFHAMDTDGDQMLSKSEFIDARLARLQTLDTDGDGSVDRSELRAKLRERRFKD